MSKSLLDLMPAEEREKALEKAEKRLARNKTRRGMKVSPEFFMAAEFGYYFGWDALLALRRGYTVDPVTGDKEVLKMTEAQLLLEGAKKVWYTKLVEQVEANVISNSYNSQGKSYEAAIKPFKERAEVEE